jgi:hypothetical protein
MKINNVEVIGGKCVVPLIEIDKPTKNGLVYEKKVIEKFILKSKSVNERLNSKTFFGEVFLGGEEDELHSAESNRYLSINPARIVSRINKFFFKKDKLMGEIELTGHHKELLDPAREYEARPRIFIGAPYSINGDKMVGPFATVAFDLVPVPHILGDAG